MPRVWCTFRSLFFFFVFSTAFFLSTSKVFADCCTDAQCGPGYQCVGVPENCSKFGNSGNCVRNYETCSGSISSTQCRRGDCCVNQMCVSCSGGGGGGGQNCTTTQDCPAGTHPDWNQVTLICVPWGGVCGNRIADNNGASERLYVSALAALERGKPDLLLILDNHCAGDFHRSEC